MLSVQLCDQNHQAIAFLGSCPLCRKKARREGELRPLVEGRFTYQGELDQALRAHYQAQLEDYVVGLFAAPQGDPRRI